MKDIFDPTVKAGDTVDLNGIPVKVASQEEIETAAVNEGVICLCMPCSDDMVYVVPGSTVAMCGACRCDVWLSPATKASMPVEVLIRCPTCLTKYLDAVEQWRKNYG